MFPSRVRVMDVNIYIVCVYWDNKNTIKPKRLSFSIFQLWWETDGIRN